MKLSGDVLQNVTTFLDPKSVHNLSQTCKWNAKNAKEYFKHPFRKGTLVYVDRFGYWTDFYRVIGSNNTFVYIQRVTWSNTAKRLFDNGESCMWKPVRYSNRFQKYSFKGSGALKHGEWILRPTDSSDVSFGRLLMSPVFSCCKK